MSTSGGDTAYRDFVVPDVVAEQSRRWLALPAHERVVPPAKPSATVMLLRAGQESAQAEVFVLRRASSMAFAAGMLAFPGGGVDPRDSDPAVPWSGPSAAAWAERLRTEEPVARELVIAAAREVFEECGVLLAGPAGGDGVVSDLSDPAWSQDRTRLLDRTQSFGELLTRRGLVLRTELLSLRGHWTTPECEPRRYDTRFFATRMPQGQIADGASSEAEIVRWGTPADLLAGADRGEDVLLPPTRVMLEELGSITDLDAWLATPRPVRALLPEPVERDGQLWMRVPV